MPLNSNTRLPQAFGAYRLEKLLGSGGQGSVFLAHDTALDRQVAIKVPQPDLAALPDVRAAFMEEGRVGAKFEHDNLCRVYTYGVEKDTPFLVLQYVAGAPLADFQQTKWMVPDPQAAVEIVRQLALALATFHDGGFLHRDLKPRNVLMARQPKPRPVLIDFGLALRFNDRDTRMPTVAEIAGTYPYMSPEQICPELGKISVASDVYSLGVILYELLFGEVPFLSGDLKGLVIKILNHSPPNLPLPGVSEAINLVCARALAKNAADRFATMGEFAEALERAGLAAGATEPWKPPMSATIIPREAIRFAFAGLGDVAPAKVENRLFLDVGNDLRAGVIDHHHVKGTGSTARLIEHRLYLIDAAIGHGAREQFTIVLHRDPDLDCIVSAYLAVAYLTTGALPGELDAILSYADRVDSGETFVSHARPFTLYAAQQRLLARPATGTENERWSATVWNGLALLDYVLDRVQNHRETIDEVDAFAAPGLFDENDRAAVLDDLHRYSLKMSDVARTAPRIARMHLPSQLGDKMEVDGLLVRDVAQASDPQRVLHFKDWARSDVLRAPNGWGFTALSVFHSSEPNRPQRCIISVTPESGASLRELGKRLDEAEARKRIEIYGVDDRKEDPTTGLKKSPRPGGYANADPWYDGRAHNYTIVDSPRSGTVLDAETIEQIFLEYGDATMLPLP